MPNVRTMSKMLEISYSTNFDGHQNFTSSHLHHAVCFSCSILAKRSQKQENNQTLYGIFLQAKHVYNMFAVKYQSRVGRKENKAAKGHGRGAGRGGGGWSKNQTGPRSPKLFFLPSLPPDPLFKPSASLIQTTAATSKRFLLVLKIAQPTIFLQNQNMPVGVLSTLGNIGLIVAPLFSPRSKRTTHKCVTHA